MNARTLFAAAALALVVIPAAMARELSIVSRQDPHPEAQTQAYFKPFSDATGIALEVLGWNGGIDTLRTKKDPATSGWDVVELQGDELLIGCEEGLLERLDWAQIGGKDHYLPQAVSDCGVGAAMFNFVLSWDKDKFQGTPTWADFWDVAKYPGKRGLRRSARTNWNSLCWRTASRRGTCTRSSARMTASTGRSGSSINSGRTSSGGIRARTRRNCSAPARC